MGLQYSPGARKLLAHVDLYKVGYHGSGNATPKTLWEGFKNKSDVVEGQAQLKGGAKMSVLHFTLCTPVKCYM